MQLNICLITNILSYNFLFMLVVLLYCIKYNVGGRQTLEGIKIYLMCK